ncbi:MAG: malonyl-CoA decarboxylase [Hyphomicrobiaceae bacterium]
MNTTFLQELLNTVAEQGRNLLPRALRGEDRDIFALSRALMSGRGEASGVAIARAILDVYRGLDPDERRRFFEFLTDGFQPEHEVVAAAARAYLDAPGTSQLSVLQRAVESPRQEYFRRLNLAPGATAQIVSMRKEMLGLVSEVPGLDLVDADLRHLLGSWFNRGFLVMRRIDWQTPAAILEKIIAYEAVHEIKGWDDLRRRLEPTDRRCFAFFHPSLVDEPLIFVEVALVDEPSASIDEVLGEPQKDGSGKPATTAVFYSISNCQEGLRGISFGNFLIKQVAEDLVREAPSLATFVTLSPVPAFARWLDRIMADDDGSYLTMEEREVLAGLAKLGWMSAPMPPESVKGALMALAARYLLEAKTGDGRPLDSVARFHLGNGARLERINWRADTSSKGLRESYGLMVNYLYDLREIETNHEAFVNDGRIAASRAVRSLARSGDRRRKSRMKALPPPDGLEADDADGDRASAETA